MFKIKWFGNLNGRNYAVSYFNLKIQLNVEHIRKTVTLFLFIVYFKNSSKMKALKITV